MSDVWLSIVAPVYNEEGCIEEFYRRVAKVFDRYPEKKTEFIFVNDGSTDRSVHILHKLRAFDP